MTTSRRGQRASSIASIALWTRFSTTCSIWIGSASTGSGSSARSEVDRDRLLPRFDFGEHGRLAHDAIDVRLNVRRLALAQEVPQSGEDLGRAGALGRDTLQDRDQLVLAHPFRSHAANAASGVIDDRSQRLVQLVGQRRGHFAHGGNPSDVGHLPFELARTLEVAAREFETAVHPQHVQDRRCQEDEKRQHRGEPGPVPAGSVGQAVEFAIGWKPKIPEQFADGTAIGGCDPCRVLRPRRRRIACQHGSEEDRHALREFIGCFARLEERPLGVELGASGKREPGGAVRMQDAELVQIKPAFIGHSLQHARLHRGRVDASVAHGLDDAFRRDVAEHEPREVAKWIDIVGLQLPPRDLKTVERITGIRHERLALELRHPGKVSTVRSRDDGRGDRRVDGAVPRILSGRHTGRSVRRLQVNRMSGVRDDEGQFPAGNGFVDRCACQRHD